MTKIGSQQTARGREIEKTIIILNPDRKPQYAMNPASLVFPEWTDEQKRDERKVKPV